MKGQCVISYGRIRMIDVDGEYHQGERATLLGRTLPNNLITQMASRLLREPTSLSWKVTIGVR